MYLRVFDMILPFKTVQNLVAEHYERDFDLILHFKISQESRLGCRALWMIFWHDFPLQSGSKHFCRVLWKRFSNYFSLQNGSNLIAGYYEGDFDMIFHFKAAKNLVSEHYEIDFFLISSFRRLEFDCRVLWRRFSNYFSLQMAQIWLQGTMKEILTSSSTLRQLKTWFQSTLK